MNPALRNLLITIAVIIIIVAGIFLWARRASAPVSLDQTGTSTTGGIQYVGSSTPVVHETSNTTQSVGPAPDYNKPIPFAAGTSADVEAALNAQLKVEQQTLAKDPKNFDMWINLGNIYKIAGDYQDAIVVWTYVTKLYPGSPIAYDNLASIYMDYVKNYPKAEADLKAAISLSPTDIPAYSNLVSLYTTYGFGTKAQAQAVISQGLKANPQNPTLLELQSQLSSQ